MYYLNAYWSYRLTELCQTYLLGVEYWKYSFFLNCKRRQLSTSWNCCRTVLYMEIIWCFSKLCTCKPRWNDLDIQTHADILPSTYDKLTNCWFNIGPSSTTLVQYQINNWVSLSHLPGRLISQSLHTMQPRLIGPSFLHTEPQISRREGHPPIPGGIQHFLQVKFTSICRYSHLSWPGSQSMIGRFTGLLMQKCRHFIN